MIEKAKAWWSEDGKWFCLLVNDGVNQATVSLTPEEATQLLYGTAVPAQSKQEPVSEAELIEAIMSCRPLLLAGLSVRDFAAAAACRIRHDFDVRHTASSHSSTERGPEVSAWPTGYQSTVTNGRCDHCGLLKRIRQYVAGWFCKGCAKR